MYDPFRNTRTPLEVIAAEQRILTMADALATWMQTEDMAEIMHLPAVDKFFTHQSNVNPAGSPDETYHGVAKVHILDKLDPDANRFFMELLRCAWERRCWQSHYGMRASPHD